MSQSKLYTVTAEFGTYIQACFAAIEVVKMGLIADVNEEDASVVVRGISEPFLFKVHSIMKLLDRKVSVTEEVKV